jgi:hypothetical protein
MLGHFRPFTNTTRRCKGLLRKRVKQLITISPACTIFIDHCECLCLRGWGVHVRTALKWIHLFTPCTCDSRLGIHSHEAFPRLDITLCLTYARTGLCSPGTTTQVHYISNTTPAGTWVTAPHTRPHRSTPPRSMILSSEMTVAVQIC